MPSHRFTLAGLLFCVTFVALGLAYAVSLWRNFRPSVNFLADRVTAVDVAADGLTGAALMGDGTLRVWDMTDGSLKSALSTLRDDRQFLGTIALSAHGDFAAVLRWIGPYVNPVPRIEIVEIGSGKVKHTLDASYDTRVVLSPTERILAVRNRHAVVVYFLDQGGALELLGELPGCEAIAFSPDGRVIASGTADGSVRFYGVANLSLLHEFKSKRASRISQLAWSPDGQNLAIWQGQGDPDDPAGTVEMARPATGESRTIHVVGAGNRLGSHIVYLPGGTALAVPYRSGVELFDPVTLERLRDDDFHETFALRIAAGKLGDTFLLADTEHVFLCDVRRLTRIRDLLRAEVEFNFMLPGIAMGICAFFFVRWRSRRLARVCAACGGRFQAEGENDANRECPACR